MNAHTRPPGASQDTPMYRRTDIAPEAFFQALGRARKAARDEIERLIEWLDSTIDVDEDSAVDDAPCDGDTDAEPSLGSFDRMSNQIKAWQTTDLIAAQDERELDNSDHEESDPAEDGGDDEPNVDDEPGADAGPKFGWNDEEAARGRYPSIMGVQL